MSAFRAPVDWLNYWDGLPLTCWRVEHETNLLRSEVQVRIEKLARQPCDGGYVLRGPAGTGKREFLSAAFQHSGIDFNPIWVSGSRYGSEIPFGAIHFLLTGLDIERLGSPLAVYGYLKRHFEKIRPRPLVILEHGVLIDGLTTAVLSQLVSAGQIKMIVIDDSDSDLSEDLAVLVRSGFLEVFQLSLLSLKETRTYIARMLDVSVSYLTALRLWRFTAGSSEALKAVVRDCQDAGVFDRKSGCAALLDHPIPTGQYMEQHTAGRLERLTLRQREILESIALKRTLPRLGNLVDQDADLDFLHARGLLANNECEWWVTNPAIAQTLISFQLEGKGDSVVSARDSHAVCAHGQAPREHNASAIADNLADGGWSISWVNTKSDALEYWNGGDVDAATGIVNEFRHRLLEVIVNEDEPAEGDSTDSFLVLLEILLSAGQLADAGDLIAEFDPSKPGSCWPLMGPCQQHRALAMTAEYMARVSQHEQANELVEALLVNLSHHSGVNMEYRIEPCMARTIRSLINSCVALGKWGESHRLIQLVLEGALPDSSLVAYAETIHGIILVLAGNQSEAQRIIEPLRHQLHSTGSKNERAFVDAVASYVFDRKFPSEEAGGSPGPSFRSRDSEPVSTLECFGRILQNIDGLKQSGNDVARRELERLKRWTVNRGEKLLASHLLALQIRDGQFHAAGLLRELQEGQSHELAEAFNILSDGAEAVEPHTLATAIGKLASLGFTVYATDDGSELFQYMSSSQKRQNSRQCNAFMASLLPDRLRTDAYMEPGQLDALTKRERFVASAAASGLSNIEIAERASVSVRTVEGHLYQVYAKLGINKRGELSALAGAGRKHGFNAEG